MGSHDTQNRACDPLWALARQPGRQAHPRHTSPDSSALPAQLFPVPTCTGRLNTTACEGQPIAVASAMNCDLCSASMWHLYGESRRTRLVAWLLWSWPRTIVICKDPRSIARSQSPVHHHAGARSQACLDSSQALLPAAWGALAADRVLQQRDVHGRLGACGWQPCAPHRRLGGPHAPRTLPTPAMDRLHECLSCEARFRPGKQLLMGIHASTLRPPGSRAPTSRQERPLPGPLLCRAPVRWRRLRSGAATC